MSKFTLFRRYASEEDGNIALTFSVAIVAILAMVGAAMDYMMTSSAYSRSQDVADAIALNAAAYVRMTDEVPTATSTSGITPGDHKASDFGYAYEGWVDGGAGNVNVNVVYDNVNKEAVVTVSGQTITSFSKIMGYDSLPFSTRSVVGFEDTEVNDVASVALVLDNSGSMAWDDKPYTTNGSGNLVAPTDSTARITALEDSVNSFMDYIGPIVGNQNGQNDKVFRSGMLAYNTTTITGRTVNMKWDTLSNGNVTSMTASGGTNSTDSMTTAADWMIAEPAIHAAQNGKTPLRYVVFMTDGANNNSSASWYATTGSGKWRRTRCQWYSGYGWYCWYDYTSSENKPNDHVGFYNSYNNYDYDWSEGDWTTPDDDATLVQCDRLKADGVTVYTIGFGLEPGTYDTNANGNSSASTTVIDQDTTDQAYAMLSACASGPDMFKTADSADELMSAFDTIGLDILNDTIRIKS